MRVEELIEAMKKGVVAFSFVKKDGTIREAHGTLVNSYFSYIPKGPAVERPGITNYWDMDAQGFRCFRNESLL